MVRSNVQQGNRYKKKTKDWYIAHGYTTEYCEHVSSIFTPRGIIYKKSDLFGADGIAMNGKEIIFWNSKVTIQAKKGVTDMVKKGRDEFARFPFPDTVRRVIVMWEPRQKPVFVECGLSTVSD